jgi:hypothetical protein
VRVAASSELIGVWGQPGTGRPYPAVERATLRELPLHVSGGERAAVPTRSPTCAAGPTTTRSTPTAPGGR